MSDTVDVGVVGLGGMGTNHARNLADLDALAAGADVAADQREAFAEAFGVPTYEDHEALLAGADLDAVVVTTPNAVHEPVATAALEAGVHVLCEKPLAATLSAAERIAAAARESDAFCTVGFHNRYSGAAALFREYRDRGAFGNVRHVEANYVRRRGIPGVGSWFTTEELAGGGALVDVGVHVVDFALHLLGFPDPVEVTGETRRDFGTDPAYANPEHFFGDWSVEEGDTFDVEDSATAFVRFADGATLSLDVAWATERDPTKTVWVRGTEGGARCTLGGDELHLRSADVGGTDHFVDTTLRGEVDPSGYRAEDEAFVEAVAAGAAPALNTVEEALAVQRVLDAVYRSSEAGRSVRLD